jgi:parvulin-like peptidyl-prolyl isomerase
MKRPAAFWIAIACIAGFGCAQLLLSSAVARDQLGKLFGCGHLLAMVDGNGIYQCDFDRRLAESDYVAGVKESERTNVQREDTLTGLVAGVAAQAHASHEKVLRSELADQLNLLRFQFLDDKAWRAVLSKSDLSQVSVARTLKNNLKTREWIATRIASQLSVTDDECRQFYDSHRDQFFLPERRNVSHLFLAAPPETPPDVVETKRAAVEALSARLAAGEDFAELAAQNSEDEATKLRGGELGYFSAKRMPPDFVEAASKLRPGEISKPVRTRLGFHILKLINVQAPRQQTFDEVRGDIAIELANKKREAAVDRLMADLRRDADYLRPF